MYVKLRLPGEQLFVAKRLGWDTAELESIPVAELLGHVLHRRAVIRWHRDQRGDDRCWLDDWVVHLMLADTPAEPLKLPADTLDRCRQFFENRQAPSDPTNLSSFGLVERLRADFPAQQALLQGAEGKKYLLGELTILQMIILQHRLSEPVTWREDQMLYQLMPERRPAFTRLPPRDEFLGVQVGTNHGCPQFVASHEACADKRACDLHCWGGKCGQAIRMVELVTA